MEGLMTLDDMRIDMFVESEPTMCVWCRYCGVTKRSDSVLGYVCLKSMETIGKRTKGVIKPFPVNTEGTRSRVQFVNADEFHPECFRPTLRDDPRILLLDELGLLGDWRKAVLNVER